MMNIIHQNAPPEAYEKIVVPVMMTQKCARLGEEKNYKDPPRKRKKKPPKKTTEEPDLLFEPMLGKLFDYSA